MSDFLLNLLQPINDSSACGAELEYDAEYIELLVTAAEREEQQFGSTIIPAQQPNWSDVAHRAGELLNRTKDLRVLAYLARARSELEGLPGYGEVLEVALQWLERYWDDIYPRIQVEGEEDPMLRINAIAALMDTAGIGRTLRNALVLQGSFGSFSLRDLESHLDTEPGTPGSSSDERLQLLLNGRESAELKAVRIIDTTLAALKQLIERRLGSSWMPDYSTFARPFRLVVRALSEADAEPLVPTAPVESALPASAPPPMHAAKSVPQRREQAVQMMDNVCLYLERYEPGHPAALLIRRAQRLMPMTFMEIIQDMVPESGQPFRHILGTSATTDAP
ncbi:type VI secretion system protein TssA [Pseudomonas sp. SCB32]|uniref:type VI secretion system protein TssA n=1 Tax=Pseudomonas sp. SCB32 TaxID=2653853 RepID=UPI001264EF05|nr:type VI secretion system protein TssA [Pseudomonas sp. SCB32]